MQFPYTYFEDEVRDGFYVPGMMKKAWAAQLEILEEISNVCKKYRIQYFAVWGTLLGAVRHKGFIPWDDDLDICMKREDYNRFLRVAQRELPKGYRLLSFHTDDYWEMLARVVNGKEICLDQEYLKKFHGFPFIAGIDIFPLDFLSPNPEEEQMRDHLLDFIALTADSLDDEQAMPDETAGNLCQIEELCNIRIDRGQSVKRQLYLLAEQMFSMYGEDEAEEITVMPLWLKDGMFKLPKSSFQEIITLPFENTIVPAPAAYDAVLRASYGDYMKSVHKWDTHDYPFYKSQQEYLEDRGIRQYRYIISPDDLRKEKYAMTKTGKKQAQEIVNLLEKAHREVQRIAGDDTAGALELLEKCQTGAISLGTMLEQIGDDHCAAIVRLLEEYCESVYHVYGKLAQGNMENLNEFYGNLQKQMDDIANKIKNCISERAEIVFLPYKASMWDSLESVWKAADADPDCDAYVIPIPYYDRNSDGSFRQMHYEGDQYPDYVPVTWYEDYDFKKRHPDMIFFHNPYDEYNLVTSVHPFFYSKNLKQFTENLIYIPYFIIDEINPSDQRAVASMEHFATVPGVIHADHVIVQSEKMRQAYIDAMVRAAGESTRKIWEDKIWGTGSPKLDRVQNTKKEDFNIPDGWRKVIEKADGKQKKVILYNTSVSALLEHGEKMLEKMRDVFRVFRENQDEVALLWRPHPLIQATIESMRPQLWAEYQKLVQEYCRDGWGIYDDSPDIDRAIALCEAYYGDGSSVAQLCKRVGLMVMIQNIYIRQDRKWMHIHKN